MELTALFSWIQQFSDKRISPSKKEFVEQLVNSILCKLNALMQLDVGYLCLNRPIPTLSGGERQRVRIATQLTCSLKGLIYILDEPCKGLHYRDITKVVTASLPWKHRYRNRAQQTVHLICRLYHRARAGWWTRWRILNPPVRHHPCHWSFSCF